MEQHIVRVAISGAGGFIGSALKEDLRKKGCSVISLSRKIIGMSLPQITNLLDGTDVIINLAGAPIVGRWTTTTKSIMYGSRIETTRKLVDAIMAMKSPPGLFISGSAVGIYKSEGIHTESSKELSSDFLGKLCQDWESEALRANGKTRVVILRTGIVLGNGGGALARMTPLFRAGLGGVIASGTQGFSWIHMQDLINAVDLLIAQKDLSGVFNFTAPQSLDNRGFTNILAKTMKKRLFLPVPSIILKLAYGEGAKALTEGQNAYPEKLLKAVFNFEFTDAESALNNLIGAR
jgi:uncharacterized protein